MSKIPVKGINPALKKVTEKLAKNNTDDAVKAVRKTMAKTAESSKPVKDIIDDTVGVSVKRRANGRREMKSAKESANIFMRTENKAMIEMNEEIADNVAKRNGLISDNRKRSQELREKYSKKATGLEDAMKNAEINQKRQQLKNNTLDLSNRGSRDYERALIKSSPDSMKKRMEEDIAKRQKSKMNSVGKNKQDEAVANPNNWVYKAAAAGVGGGLVLSMSNNRGQQSNSQLYGQGGY